jgi:hypothetical protein
MAVKIKFTNNFGSGTGFEKHELKFSNKNSIN